MTHTLRLHILATIMAAMAMHGSAAGRVASPAWTPLAPDSVASGAHSHSLPERALGRIDSLLDIRDRRERQRVDTAYRQRATERLRLKVSFNGSGSTITTRGVDAGTEFEAMVEAQNKYTMTLAASYRGLSASLAINPAHITGRNSDLEFNVNAYSNRLGADIIYQYASTYKGHVMANNQRHDMPGGLVSQQALTANGYYVFNSRRFSYPAAFTQSWVQRRSCGSFMLGMQVYAGWMNIDANEQLGNPSTRINLLCGAVGAGYGYNLVTRRGWLFHLSALPQVVVFSRSRLTTSGIRGKMPYRFPNIMAVGRLAVVRHFNRWFAGLSSVVNTSALGDDEQLYINQLKWRGRVFVGLKIF